MIRFVLFFVVCLGVLTGCRGRTSEELEPWTWVADKAHSSIQFRAQHWGIHDVVGWFEDYDVIVHATYGQKFTDAVVEVRLRPESVRMPNPGMAGNLRGMFETDKYPEVVFKSTNVRRYRNDTYRLRGELTMKDVTKDIEFMVTLNGYGLPPGSAPGFTGEGKLNRVEFGVGDAVTHTNDRPLMGETVYITFNIRLGYGEED